MSVAHRQLLSLAHRRLLQQSRLNTAKVFTRSASSKPRPELEDPALRVDNLRVDGTSRVERSRGVSYSYTGVSTRRPQTFEPKHACDIAD